MRKLIVAGNWKMNTLPAEGVQLAAELTRLIQTGGTGKAEVILAPPFTHLQQVVDATAGSVVQVAAQNCSAEASGAFTGDVSASMIQACGASHVIIGHSERRSIFGETDETLLKKIRQALGNSLVPIFCCGELLEERESGRHLQVVEKQLKQTVFMLEKDDFSKIIIAYEPVWAIGTGKTATPAQAQEMHAAIREMVAGKFGEKMADELTILYGGSCKASNAREIFEGPDVDGGLIGGASLSADEFFKIIHSF